MLARIFTCLLCSGSVFLEGKLAMGNICKIAHLLYLVLGDTQISKTSVNATIKYKLLPLNLDDLFSPLMIL